MVRELVCILALLCISVVLSPFWLSMLVWQRHQWEKQVRSTMRGSA